LDQNLHEQHVIDPDLLGVTTAGLSDRDIGTGDQFFAQSLCAS
jgi:hypothetical protein